MYLGSINPMLQAARERYAQPKTVAQKHLEASNQARQLLASGMPWARVQDAMRRAGTWAALNTI